MAGSVHKDPDSGKWYYMLAIKDENGKRKQKKKRGFSTKTLAKKALVEAENAVNKGTYVEESKELFVSYILDWFEIKKKNIPRSALVYKQYINDYIVKFFNKQVALSDLKLIHVEKFINTMHDKGYSAATIRKAYNIISSSLDYAVDSGLLARNVAKKATLPSNNKKEMQVWNEDEVNHFLDTAKDNEMYILFYLALVTGMRQGELLGLRFSDIDFTNKTITVRQVLSHDAKQLYSGAKTNAGNRTITISDSDIEKLKQHKAKLDDLKQQNKDTFIDNDLVVCSKIGTPVNPSNILNRFFYPLIDKAGVPKIRFHDLRHTHATLLLAKGVNVKVISERLGHSRTSITLDTYSHVLPHMQDQVTNVLENIIKS